jgi:hypothetical protein
VEALAAAADVDARPGLGGRRAGWRGTGRDIRGRHAALAWPGAAG